VRERTHVPIEKAALVLAKVQRREVSAGVHPAHDEHPRLAPNAIQVDEHFEEVNLRKLARRVREWNEHFPALPLPFRNQFPNRGQTGSEALRHKHRVHACCRQTLLASCPFRRLAQQRLNTCRNEVRDGPATTPFLLGPDRHCLLQVLPNRVARDPHLARHAPDSDALNQYLVTNNVYLIHS
jgi:hypothetical protein